MHIFGNETDPDFAILWLHGFGGNRHHLKHHAEAVASSCPQTVNACLELPSLVKGGTFKEIFIDSSVRSAQENAVKFVVGYCSDLRSKFGPDLRIILAGHSAGGAIAIEAAAAMQQDTSCPAVTALLLLDAVPWEDTINIASELEIIETSVLSLRCDPSASNMRGKICSVTDRWLEKDSGTGARKIMSVRIRGGRHFDPVESRWPLRMMGLIGSAECRDAMTTLARAFLTDLVKGTSTELDYAMQTFSHLVIEDEQNTS